MNLRSMCLARLDTPILVATLFPEDESVPTLTIDLSVAENLL